MKTLFIIFGIITWASIVFIYWLHYKDKAEEKPSKPVSEPEKPVDEPEKPTDEEYFESIVGKHKFKTGYWIVDNEDDRVLQIVSMDDVGYQTQDGAFISYKEEKYFHLWTIQDAKDGDVLYSLDSCRPFIYKERKPFEQATAYCGINEYGKFFVRNTKDCIIVLDKYVPATKEQRDLLFQKMKEAGYEWNADTLTLSKIEEEPVESPVEEPTDAPVDEEPDAFDELIKYFFGDETLSSPVEQYLYDIYDEGFKEFYQGIHVFDKDNFPTPMDYFKSNPCTDAEERLYAWLFAMVLSELMPERRNEFYQKAYDYKFVGKEVPLYGYSFYADPSIMIMVAAEVWAMTRDEEIIPTLRKELGSSMISYTKDISELYVDICKFLPSAPFPFLDAYTYRPKGLPTDVTWTADVDEEIHNHIYANYTLDIKDETLRQATIQAIANKEYKKPHLFGKPRKVTDPKYGEMSFNPVFGLHNLGIEIPDNGAIASLAYEVGKICTDSRKPLLDQEYGRRRPGQGDSDPSANKNKAERALVNYAIEEGDGHTTGYYNKGGDYVDGNGNHIGDYETYYQGQLYANSYPSGHSAFIEGVALVLSLIMPDKADRIEKAKNEFAISRCICRYHWMSDTIIGRIVGTIMPPVLAATTNFDFDRKLKDAKKEYEAIISGDIPSPVYDKVNTSLSYVCGGYGSCHVDAGESSIGHCCNKEAKTDRHPSITVSQRVSFDIKGAGVTTADGKTSGVWEAGVAYYLNCPAVADGEEKTATITMRNEHGVRVLYYKLSRSGTHDDGAGSY